MSGTEIARKIRNYIAELEAIKEKKTYSSFYWQYSTGIQKGKGHSSF
ncbi:hypothetical protein Goari_010502 [Gossypium aridum]|uniref:Uncharacterized protein n=1 Tax=Gossypium aridum TaxID=34290 RepID=A0A7J8Y089_GOSAI|nr:hypothetical protein [Gossypium aridum]